MPILDITSTTLSWIINTLLITLLVWSTKTDLRSRKIPNRLTYTACAIALLVNFIASYVGTQNGWTLNFGRVEFALPGTIGFGQSLLGACGCFLVMLVLYDLAGSGGGDLKLATALGACLGLQMGLMVILWCHLMAGVVLLLWAVTHAGLWRVTRLLVRSVAAMFLPGFFRPPQRQETELLQTPIPLAGFFAAAVGLQLIAI